MNLSGKILLQIALAFLINIVVVLTSHHTTKNNWHATCQVNYELLLVYACIVLGTRKNQEREKSFLFFFWFSILLYKSYNGSALLWTNTYVIIKPSNIAILLKIIKDNQNIDNISIIKNNKGYFK